jgi:Peptide methionine sulfoxide reductase
MTTATERAVLAGGCFWGMQDLIRKLPGVALAACMPTFDEGCCRSVSAPPDRASRARQGSGEWGHSLRGNSKSHGGKTADLVVFAPT